MTVVIVTVVTSAVVTVVIVTYFSKKQLYTLTTDEMFSGQLFVILAMFFFFFFRLPILFYVRLLFHPHFFSSLYASSFPSSPLQVLLLPQFALGAYLANSALLSPALG